MKIVINGNLTSLVGGIPPLKHDGVSSSVWMMKLPTEWKVIIHSCSKPPTRYGYILGGSKKRGFRDTPKSENQTQLNGRSPSSLDGLFHGKSEKMDDDCGSPPWLWKPTYGGSQKWRYPQNHLRKARPNIETYIWFWVIPHFNTFVRLGLLDVLIFAIANGKKLPPLRRKSTTIKLKAWSPTPSNSFPQHILIP